MRCVPSCRDSGLLASTRALLEAARYDEETVCRMLRLPDLAALSSDQFGELAARLREEPGALPILIRLLLLEQTVRRREADVAVGRQAIQNLMTTGLLALSAPGQLAAVVALYPCDGALITTDGRLRPRAPAPVARRNRVMYLGADSYLLARLAPTVPPDGAVLDLRTGSGVQAILAARVGARVVGVDINPRAVAFARFNASLNGVADRCAFLTGDLYRPVARRTFGLADLVLANVPFVPSPERGAARTIFRDGGPRGDDVLSRALAAVERRLAPGGLAVFVSAFADVRDLPSEDRIARWLGPRTHLSGVLMVTDSATPDALAAVHATGVTSGGIRHSESRRRRWLASFRAAGIERIRGGLLVLMRPSTDAPRTFRTVGIVPPSRPARGAVRAAVAAVLRTRNLGGLRWLSTVATLASGATLAVEAGASLPTVRTGAVLRGPLGVARLATPEMLDLVRRLDGHRSMGVVVDQVAAARAVMPFRLALDLESEVLDLFAAGVLDATADGRA